MRINERPAQGPGWAGCSGSLGGRALVSLQGSGRSYPPRALDARGRRTANPSPRQPGQQRARAGLAGPHAPPGHERGGWAGPGNGKGDGHTPLGTGRQPKCGEGAAPAPDRSPGTPNPPARRASGFLTLCSKLLLCAAILEGPPRTRPPPGGAVEKGG